MNDKQLVTSRNHIDQYNGVFIIVFKNPFNFLAFVYIFISLNLESDYIDTSYRNFEVNRFTKMVKIRTFERFEKLHDKCARQED